MDSLVTASKLQNQVTSYLADFAGNAGAPKEVLPAKNRSPGVLSDLVDKLWDGEAHVHDLGRAYKHAPHHAPALLYKYLVHRVKNIDAYDSKDTGAKLDTDFFNEHAAGNAGSYHADVTPRHLNEWLDLNAHLPLEVLNHRDNLQKMVTRGIGLNVKMINSEPHVAMTRGLNTFHVGPEHALSSFADLPDTGFGRHQHHMWIPIKDLWYGYPAAPPYPRGEHGHENEWLFTHGGERYQAEPDDVHTNWASELDPMQFRPEGDIVADDLPQLPYDTMESAELDGNVSEMTFDQLRVLHARNRMGQAAYQEYRQRGGAPQAIADVPHMPNREATELALHQLDLGDKNILALYNPNLTPGDLINIVQHPNFIPENDPGQEKFGSYLRGIAKNPSFSEDVANNVMTQISDKDLHNHAVLLARYSPVPVRALHRYFFGALGAGDTVPWSPEVAIAKAFNDEDAPNPTQIPTAFNNSAITDQYLLALINHFAKNPDDADDARNIYHRMLTGARISEGTTATLVENFFAGNPLEGTSMEEYGDLLEDVARFNPHLSPRAMIHLAKTEEGRDGLLSREWLPEGVQVELAGQADSDTQIELLAERADMTPLVADSIVASVKNPDHGIDDEGMLWVGKCLGGNLAIPMPILEKHMTKEAKDIAAAATNDDEADPLTLESLTPLERGLLHGIFRRMEDRNSQHIVHPLPPGAAS
jgi:hypothetical protein